MTRICHQERRKRSVSNASLCWIHCYLALILLLLSYHGIEAYCFISRKDFQHRHHHPPAITTARTKVAVIPLRKGYEGKHSVLGGRWGMSAVVEDGNDESGGNNKDDGGGEDGEDYIPPNFYNLGLGKNPPLPRDHHHQQHNEQQQQQQQQQHVDNDNIPPPVVYEVSQNWVAPEPVKKPPTVNPQRVDGSSSSSSSSSSFRMPARKVRKMVARDNASQLLRGALWHERHFDNDEKEGGASSSNTANNNNNNFPLASSYLSSTPPTTPSATTTTVTASSSSPATSSATSTSWMGQLGCPPEPSARYPNIDLSVPLSVYNDNIAPTTTTSRRFDRQSSSSQSYSSSSPPIIDVVWDNLRYEAYEEAQREPLLVSFLYSTILNHPSLESALAFCLANRLSTPGSLISTQLQSLILQALQESSDFRRKVRADLLAVRDRDPACMSLPHVFLYFKGFQALQAHRVAHIWWRQEQPPQYPTTNSFSTTFSPQPQQQHRRQVLAHYLQSQVSQTFQIDIHPNATLGSGIMLDHGTGIVIGETARVGDNCSILHHVTLGGSGKKGVDRHPKVGNGVLLGAGSTVLGNVHIGNGCQVGAGTLVITDLPPHCVAVGVPAKIIGQFVDVTEQPSIGMNQMLDATNVITYFATEGI